MRLKESTIQHHEDWLWGTMSWLVNDALRPGADLSLARMTLRPGGRTPGHRHPNCNEVVYVISGEGIVVVEDAVHTAAANSIVFVSAGSRHHIENRGRSKAELLVCYSAGARLYEPAESESHHRLSPRINPV